MTKKNTVKKKAAKKKTTKKVAKKLPKVYTFLEVELINEYSPTFWAGSKILSNGEQLYVELNKDKDRGFSAMLEYNNLYLDLDYYKSAEEALTALLLELKELLNPLTELGV